MKARNQLKDKGSKKVDEAAILRKIAREKRFQKQLMKEVDYNYRLSKNQRKKLYEQILKSIEKVRSFNDKLGVKSKDYYEYFKTLLNNVTEDIEKSQGKLKRVVLFEKVYKD